MTKEEFYVMSLNKGLKCLFGDANNVLSRFIEELSIDNFKKKSTPLLYPLDYLTKPITHNGETFVPIIRLGWCFNPLFWSKSNTVAAIYNLSLNDALKLIEWHFAVGLKEDEFIDVTTLPKNPYEL